MALTLVGSAKGVTTVTIPAHAVGDLIVIFAFRDGNTTPPSVGSGFTSKVTRAGTTCSAVVGFKVATSTSDTSGTWTNATEVICHVYRPTSGNTIALGATGVNSGTTNTANYAALSMQDASGASWVAGFIGHRSIDTTIESPPTGMTNRQDQLDATAEAAGHDTNGGVTSWASTNKTITGTASGWCSITVEILDISPRSATASVTLDALTVAATANHVEVGVWDATSDVGGYYTLSNSDRTAALTLPVATGYAAIVGIDNKTDITGSFFSSFKIDALGGEAVDLGYFAVSSGTYLSLVYINADGGVRDVFGNLIDAAPTPLATGDVIDFAVTIVAPSSGFTAWIRYNGTWLSTCGDPAASGAGYSFPGDMTGLPLLVGMGVAPAKG